MQYLDVQDSESSSNDITALFSFSTSNNDDGEATPFWIFPEFGPLRGGDYVCGVGGIDF